MLTAVGMTDTPVSHTLAAFYPLRIVAVATTNDLELPAERRRQSCQHLIQFVETMISVGTSNPLQDDQ